MIKIEYNNTALLVEWTERVKLVGENIASSVEKKYVGKSRKTISKKELEKDYKTLSELEKKTLNSSIGKGWRKKYKSKDNLTIPKFILDEISYDFLVFLNQNSQKNYWELIYAKASDLEQLIKDFEKQSKGVLSSDKSKKKEERSKLFNVLERIFVDSGYAYLRSKPEFYKAADLNVCPYCNHTPIGIKEKEGKEYVTGELDHFYCKELYPYLALTLSNLVPSCNGCNGEGSGKGHKDMMKEGAVNPHNLLHSHGIDFSLDFTDDGTVTSLVGAIDKMTITLNFTLPNIDKNNSIFGLKETYNKSEQKERALLAHKEGKLYAQEPYKEYLDKTLVSKGIPISIERQFYDKLKVSRWEKDYSKNADSCFLMSIFKHTVEKESCGKITIDL